MGGCYCGAGILSPVYAEHSLPVAICRETRAVLNCSRIYTGGISIVRGVLFLFIKHRSVFDSIQILSRDGGTGGCQPVSIPSRRDLWGGGGAGLSRTFNLRHRLDHLTVCCASCHAGLKLCTTPGNLDGTHGTTLGNWTNIKDTGTASRCFA